MGQSKAFAWRPGGTPNSLPRGKHAAPDAPPGAEVEVRDTRERATAIFTPHSSRLRRCIGACAPRAWCECGDFEIASEVFAVRYLPGDFFTVEEASGGLILALGDVCGKGLAAGMWTPCLVGLVRVHAAATSEPHAIVAGVNREFCRMHAPLTSVFMARLDPASGMLDYCSAGHPPALLLRAGGRLESLSEGGMLLGMAADASFRQRTCRTAASVTSCWPTPTASSSRATTPIRNSVTSASRQQLRLARTGSADRVLFSVLAAVQDFAAPNALTDDTTLVVVRHRDDEGASGLT